MLHTRNVSSGLLSALMACTGSAVLIVKCADTLGLTRADAVSWLCAVYLIGGAFNLLLALKFKIPIAGCHSMTSAAFLSMMAIHFPLRELAGGFIMAGAIIAVLGASGLFGKVLELIPKPMIDAMLAGIVLNYVVAVIPAVKSMPLAGCLSVIGFVLTPKITKSIPPLLGMLVLGTAGLLIEHHFPPAAKAEFGLLHGVVPVFTTNGLISIAVPIAILILSNDIAVALSALKKNGYSPPANKTIVYSGLGTLLVGFLGGHAVTVGGMMTTLCSSEEAGEKDQRIGAAVVSSVLVAIFGLFAWDMIVFINRLPAAFIALVSGFSLAGVLACSLQSVFSETSYRYSVLFAFIIAIANVSFFGVSSPVWSLLVGVITAKVLGEGKYAMQSGLNELEQGGSSR